MVFICVGMERLLGSLSLYPKGMQFSTNSIPLQCEIGIKKRVPVLTHLHDGHSFVQHPHTQASNMDFTYQECYSESIKGGIR
jgi:hypothetical protein